MHIHSECSGLVRTVGAVCKNMMALEIEIHSSYIFRIEMYGWCTCTVVVCHPCIHLSVRIIKCYV